MRVARLDGREVPRHEPRGVLRHEAVGQCGRARSARRAPRRCSRPFVTATSRPPGSSTRAISARALLGRIDVVQHPGRDDAVEALVLELRGVRPVPTRASTPRLRVISTIRADWSIATTSASSSRSRRSASSPSPGPISRIRRGRASAIASNRTSRASGPSAPEYAAFRAASRVSSAYSVRTTGRRACLTARRSGLPAARARPTGRPATGSSWRRRRRTRRRVASRARSGPPRRRAAARARASDRWKASSGSQPWSDVMIRGRRPSARRAGRGDAGRSPGGSGGSSPGRCDAPRACRSRRG